MNNQDELQALHPPKNHGRRFLLWLGRVVAGLVILSLIGAVFESVSEASNTRAYPPPGQMVDVGGYRLHICCTGMGSPTVVIDAGLGDWSTAWGFVQTEVAKTTQVCTYDRAGSGWSESGQLPRDASQFVNELHTLLQKANLPGPFLLVGHSLGGLPVRVFTGDHPSEVAGVVLIDSMFPGQGRSSPTEANSLTTNQTHAYTPLPVLARFGIVRMVTKLLGEPGSSPAEKASYGISVTPKHMQALADELKGIPDSLSQADAVKSFGDIPLIVLSRGLDQDSDWQAGQAKLLQLSTRSQQLFAEKSGHNIELDQPEAAVGAIVKMVQMIRQEQAGSILLFYGMERSVQVQTYR
jgi:pimeloyl-ACP methyl ester carboxylesterase